MKKYTDAENNKIVLDIIYGCKVHNTEMILTIMLFLFQGELSVNELLALIGKKGNRKYYDIAIIELTLLGYISWREVEFDKNKRKVYFVTPFGMTKEKDYEIKFAEAGINRAAMLNRK